MGQMDGKILADLTQLTARKYSETNLSSEVKAVSTSNASLLVDNEWRTCTELVPRRAAPDCRPACCSVGSSHK